MRIPLLSKFFVVLHTVIAVLVFLWVWANDGGYHNGLQWAIMAVLDFPVWLPLSYLPEGDSRFNPALMSNMALNTFYLGYALVFGSLWWMGIGWTLQRLYKILKKRGASTPHA